MLQEINIQQNQTRVAGGVPIFLENTGVQGARKWRPFSLCGAGESGTRFAPYSRVGGKSSFGRPRACGQVPAVVIWEIPVQRRRLCPRGVAGVAGSRMACVLGDLPTIWRPPPDERHRRRLVPGPSGRRGGRCGRLPIVVASGGVRLGPSARSAAARGVLPLYFQPVMG